MTYDGGTSQDRGPAAKGRILSCVDTPRYAAFAGECGAAAADVTVLAPAHPDFRQSCGFDPPVTAFRSPAQDGCPAGTAETKSSK